jgi:hypothetical protein
MNHLKVVMTRLVFDVQKVVMTYSLFDINVITSN